MQMSIEEIKEIFTTAAANQGEKKKAKFMLNDGNKNSSAWIKNPYADENDQDNSNKPFYLALPHRQSETHVTLKLSPIEQPQCKVQAFLSPNFDIPNEDVMEYSKSAEHGIDDMVEIDELNHATLLHNLKSRYEKNEIYTYVGPILLATNPFKAMPHLLTEEVVQRYKKIIASKTPLEERRQHPPHIFAITSMAFKQMIENRMKQAIVISGESGSGKTESAKCAMKFLTSLSQKSYNSGEPGIEQKILDTNPILESFGNAKTVRNNNSSRFGKYVLLYFGMNGGDIKGARVKNYLLEKSRVVGPASNERNYHVFYHLIRGAKEEHLQKLGLVNKISGKRLLYPEIAFLKNGADVDQAIVNDVELFDELVQQFQALGFTSKEQESVWHMVAACLHLGELQFDESTFDENGKPCSIVNKDRIEIIAQLLGIENPQDLASEIVNKAGMPGQTVRAPYKLNECLDSRDSLAKAIYDQMFNWLVERMNLTILPENETDDQFKLETKTIGLLDIFGFENFKDNNFEQLCINYVNEKLHKLYISAIFDAEKIELKNEGLQDRIAALKYPSLTSLDVIKLLDEKLQTGGGAKLGGAKQIVGGSNESKNGIFSIVNDCSTSKPRPNWEQLLKKIEDQHKGSNVFKKEKQKERFMIKHSAKDVIYDVRQFIDRNVDEISTTLEQCIITKSDKQVSWIFQGIVSDQQEKMKDKSKQGPAKKTIWQKFSTQMQDLMFELAEPLLDFNKQNGQSQEQQPPPQKNGGKMQMMSNQAECEPCELHFIRCIKPNEIKKKETFICAMCLQQITYMGVLESVDLKQKNYPYRKGFEEFYMKYELLSPIYGQQRYEQMNKSGTDFKGLSTQILKNTLKGEGSDFYAIGNTKILMLSEIVLVLETSKNKARELRDKSAILIKREFSLFMGLVNAQQNKQKCQHVQHFLKTKRQHLIDKRAQQFLEKAKQAIILYKTEKRKDYESRAALVLADAYRKHMFRKQLQRGIRERQKIVRVLSNYAMFLRLRKYFICYNAAQKIVTKAWEISKQRKEQRSIWTIQRVFRGFCSREKKMAIVVSAMKAKENLKLHVAAKKVQRRLRGLIVRRRLQAFDRQVQKIQAFVRMKWYKEIYDKLRKDTTTIQRGVRRFLARRDIIKQRLATYLGQEISILSNIRQIEYQQLYGATTNFNESDQQSNQYGKPLVNANASSSSHTPNSLKKISLFSRVIDLHILTDISDIYSLPWSLQLSRVSKEGTSNNTQGNGNNNNAEQQTNQNSVMAITHGQTHTIVVTNKNKLYVWGWNDNGQCAKNNLETSEVTVKGNPQTKQAQVPIEEYINGGTQNYINTDNSQGNIKIKQCVAAGDRCMVLICGNGNSSMNSNGNSGVSLSTEQTELIVWGGNDKGQLGLGTYEDEFIPKKVDFFSKQGIKVQMIAGGGDLNYVACENGEAYAWPFQRGHTTFSLPVKMPFSDKVKISRVACGYNFGFFNSTQGLVYSQGKDNSEGQLGLGHIYPRDLPELIVSLKDAGERIDSIECGFRHAIAKSSLGKVYTWGWGGSGQLGHGHFDSEMSPRLLNIEKTKQREKVIQVACGYSHTLVLIESSRELFIFGSSGTISQQPRPVQLRLNEVLPDLFPDISTTQFTTTGGAQMEFAIVKVNSSWSKSMSVSSVVFADLRAVNTMHSHQKLQSALQQLAQKWDPREVMPPYIDTIAGLFSVSTMKMPGSNGGVQQSVASAMQSKLGGKIRSKQVSNAGIDKQKGSDNIMKKTSQFK